MMKANGLYTRAEWWAAMQLAVWEVLYDTGGSFDLRNGRFQVVGGVSSTIEDLATSWLATSDTVYSGDILIPLTNPSGGYGIPDPNTQEMLYKATPLEGAPVPEIPTFITGALLLLPFGLSALKAMRQRRSA